MNQSPTLGSAGLPSQRFRLLRQQRFALSASVVGQGTEAAIDNFPNYQVTTCDGKSEEITHAIREDP